MSQIETQLLILEPEFEAFKDSATKNRITFDLLKQELSDGYYRIKVTVNDAAKLFYLGQRFKSYIIADLESEKANRNNPLIF